MIGTAHSIGQEHGSYKKHESSCKNTAILGLSFMQNDCIHKQTPWLSPVWEAATQMRGDGISKTLGAK